MGKLSALSPNGSPVLADKFVMVQSSGPNDVIATGTNILAMLGGTGATFSPTWTNLSLGNATQTARYVQFNKFVYFTIAIVVGSTTSVGTGPIFTLPVTAQSSAKTVLGSIYFEDNSAPANNAGFCLKASTTQGVITVFGVGGGNATNDGVTASVPFPFAVNDLINISGSYEAA